MVPYNESGAPRYEELYSTEHCRLLMTLGGSILEKWNFGGRMSMQEIAEARRREMKFIFSHTMHGQRALLSHYEENAQG